MYKKCGDSSRESLMIFPLHQLKPKTKTQNNFFGKHWFFSQIISKKAKMIISFFYEKIQK